MGRRAHRLLVSCALAVLLSGCPLRPPPPTTEVVGKALPQGTSIPPTWSASPSTSPVTGDWLASFHDPGLDAVVAEAIAHNLDLRQAAARVEEARQTVVVVGSQLWPQVGVNIGGHRTGFKVKGKSDTTNSNQEYLGIDWEIDLWGRLRSERAAAQQQFEATDLDYAFARQSLAATTAKSWYLAIETRQLLALAEENVGVYQKLLDLVKQRRAAGKVADLDVAEASASLDAAQSQLEAAQGAYSQARRSLELLVGRYPAAEIEVAQSFAPVPPPVGLGLPSELLERRPDVIAAERQVLATFRTKEAANLALLPSFSLTLEGGRLSNNVLSLLQINPWLYHGGIGMDIPIWTGGRLLAQIKIATAEEEQAVAAYGSVVLSAFDEVESTLTNGDLFAQRLRYDEDALAARTEAVRIAKVRYQAGAIDLLSVLELQGVQIETHENVIKLRNAELANFIDLHLALGGSFDAAPAAVVSP